MSTSAFGVEHVEDISKSRKSQRSARTRSMMEQASVDPASHSRATKYANARLETTRMGRWAGASPEATGRLVRRNKSAMASAVKLAR